MAANIPHRRFIPYNQPLPPLNPNGRVPHFVYATIFIGPHLIPNLLTTHRAVIVTIHGLEVPLGFYQVVRLPILIW